MFGNNGFNFNTRKFEGRKINTNEMRNTYRYDYKFSRDIILFYFLKSPSTDQTPCRNIYYFRLYKRKHFKQRGNLHDVLYHTDNTANSVSNGVSTLFFNKDLLGSRLSRLGVLSNTSESVHTDTYTCNH
jgi:hypothetical protein